MTTKEQERKALAQIRKIVESLGEDSYIGMAFEGCFEMAAENIENDFGCSMKQRAEIAEKKLATAEMDNRDLRANIAKLKQICADIKSKVLTTAEAGSIKAILYNAKAEAAEKAKNSAQIIVETAEEPNSTEFQQAVSKNRAYTKMQEQYEVLIQRILEIMG